MPGAASGSTTAGQLGSVTGDVWILLDLGDHLSNEKRTMAVCLGYKGGYTAQLCGDY